MLNSDAAAEGILDAAEAETLSGDVRDALLTHLRSMRVPWSLLAEDEQQDLIDAVSKTAEHAVRKIATTVAQRGFEHLGVTLGKWTVDKGAIDLKVSITGTTENITALAEHGKGAVLVLAEVADFIGERAAATPDPKQKPLPLDDAA